MLYVIFRETNENNYLLKEQMTDLKQKLERAEQRCVDMAKVEVENEVQHCTYKLCTV